MKKLTFVGVINTSPESFFKGSVPGKNQPLKAMVNKMISEGADILDVGAMSTAPYLKTEISEKEETKRLITAIASIRKITSLPISADTSRAVPAREALKAGATIVNDVTGFKKDPHMPEAAKKAKKIILMANPLREKEKTFKDPIKETIRILKTSLSIAAKHNIPKSKIIIDPGIGFFRNTNLPWWQWDLTLLRKLNQLSSLHTPILMGVSRKSFIGQLSNQAPAEDRLPGSLAATMTGVKNGATFIRTHDVGATKQFLRITNLLRPKSTSALEHQ